MYCHDIHVQVQVSSNIDGHGFCTHMEAMPIHTHLETIPTHALSSSIDGHGFCTHLEAMPIHTHLETIPTWTIISNPCPPKTHGHGRQGRALLHIDLKMHLEDEAKSKFKTGGNLRVIFLSTHSLHVHRRVGQTVGLNAYLLPLHRASTQKMKKKQ